MRKLAACILAGIGFLSVRSFAQNTFPATGNVGIGTTSPNNTLQVVGDITVGRNGGSAWYFQSPASDLRIVGGTSGANLNLVPLGGNVGIGTTTPATALQVSGALTLPWNGSGTTMIQTDGGSGWGTNRYNSIVQTGWTSTMGDYLQLTSTGNSPPSNHLGLYVAQSGFYWGTATITSNLSTSPLMTLTGAGSLGIGTTSPGAKLEIDGNVKLTSGSGASITYADGTTQSTAWTGVLCGGDYAESVDVNGDRTKYQPGDVLVIDARTPGHFLKSADPYSTSVTGIYATKPGVVGRRQTGPKKADEVPMAMIGIVPTKVSAENGPIRAGDLLVTSSTVGYAMKGTDRSRMPGAIVGKALGNLESGRGVIEVVVTLQ